MKISVASLGRDPTGTPLQPSSIQAAHWRKSLEIAQWQARQRIAPQRPGDRGAAGSNALQADAEPRASAALSHPAAGVAGEAVRVPAGAGGGNPLAGPYDPLVSAVLVAAREGLRSGAFGAADPVVSLMLTRPPVPGGEAAWRISDAAPSPAPADLACVEPGEWPQVVVTASLQGARLSVSMRDGSITRDDAAGLFARLRERLRESGIELDSLVINGWCLTDEGRSAFLPLSSST